MAGHPISRENLAGYVELLRRAMISRRSQGLRNVGSGNVGLRWRLLGEQRIEIDELRIVSRGSPEPCAAMKMHQGLHAPGVEMVHMLMPQRYAAAAPWAARPAQRPEPCAPRSPSRQSSGWRV